MKCFLSVSIVATFALVGCAGSGSSATSSTEDGWTSLFNGRDLTGWTPKFAGYDAGEDPLETYVAESGVLRVSYANYDTFGGRFGHLFHDEPLEAPYDLRLEYRFVGEQVPGAAGWAFKNSGVMFHGQSLASMQRDQNFPVSLEAQFLGGDGENERSTGNLCTPGTLVDINGVPDTRHCIPAEAPTFHGDEWVEMLIEVRRDVIRHIVNGEVVLTYTSPRLNPSDDTARSIIEARGGEAALTGGTISLQAESHPIEFRRIAVRRGR